MSKYILLHSSPPRISLLSGVFLFLVLNSSSAYALYVLPNPGAGYQAEVVGDINSDFYQEVVIQNFGSYQGGPGSASGGSTRYDPLGYGGSTYGTTGNASGNPTRVKIWQINKSQDMVLDFLKDNLTTKPRVIQSITSPKYSAEFSVDMRAISYSDTTTVAPVINTQSLTDPFGSPTPMTWDIAIDSQNLYSDAAHYSFTAGSGSGGSSGTYSYVNGGFNERVVEWWRYFDVTDSQNVWTNSTNKPQ